MIDFICSVSVSVDNQTIKCKLKVFELKIEIDQFQYDRQYDQFHSDI